MKDHRDQRPALRRPAQARAQHKVELILEAAMRLLDRGGMAALTTNAVAETAGVSIGTLYQYFANKAAVLDALADREIGAMSDRLLAAFDDDVPAEERIARIFHAVAASYGGRRQVHRLLAAWSFQRGADGRLSPTLTRLLARLTREDASGRPPLSPTDAFVLTHAFNGVIHALIAAPDGAAPPAGEVEQAMSRLVRGYRAG